MIKSTGTWGLAIAAAICAACNSEDAPPPGGGATGGCNVDYSRLTSHRKVAFRADVMPILNGSCGKFVSCHDPDKPQGGLVLGDVCPSGEACPPLSEAAISAVYASLLGASSTAPAAKRVAPNKPAESFLLDKAADIQNDKGYACTPQAAGVQGCGDGMPPGGPEITLCTQPDGQERFDVLATWVLQGAPND